MATRPRPNETEAAQAGDDAGRRFDPIAETRRQWVEHGLGNLDHMEATTAIMRTQQIILSRMTQALRPYDLSFPQYEALLLLEFSSRGVLPLGIMGRRLLLHPATVTNTVDQLERKKLVTRERHPTDRRMVLAKITKKGSTTVRAANEKLGEIRYGLVEMDVKDAKGIVKAVRRFRDDIGDYVDL